MPPPLRFEFLPGYAPTAQWLESPEGTSALGNIRVRRALYAQLLAACASSPHPDLPVHAPLLRALLAREVTYRATDEDDDGTDYENLYRCALLLYDVGALEDVLPLWRAKHTNMDTGSGLDIQCLLGAGVSSTLAYLATLDGPVARDAHADISRWAAGGELDDLSSWRSWRYQYFGGPS